MYIYIYIYIHDRERDNIVRTTSNWFREGVRRLGYPYPGGLALYFRGANPRGRMWVMVTRYVTSITREAVMSSRNAVGHVETCRAVDRPIDDKGTVVELSGCSLLPGVRGKRLQKVYII